jgi:hypothetical protein
MAEKVGMLTDLTMNIQTQFVFKKIYVFFLSYNQCKSDTTAFSFLYTQLNCEHTVIKYASQSALCWKLYSLNLEVAGGKFLQTKCVKLQTYTTSNAGEPST